MNSTPSVFTAVLLSVSSLPSFAGEKELIQYEPAPAPARSVFEKGRWEYSSLWQGYASFSFNHNGPTINYLQSSYRLGYMLTDPSGEGFWHGNYEIMAEGLYASVLDGPGDWIAGGNILLRRNFITPGSKTSWYAQAGGGVVWNDIYKDLNQDLVGRSREFSIVAGVGWRYQFKPRWSLQAEIGYRHLSNADTVPRNTGLNSVGGGIGLGYTF